MRHMALIPCPTARLSTAVVGLWVSFVHRMKLADSIEEFHIDASCICEMIMSHLECTLRATCIASDYREKFVTHAGGASLQEPRVSSYSLRVIS